MSEELLHPGLADSLSAECGVEKKTRKPQNPNPKANPQAFTVYSGLKLVEKWKYNCNQRKSSQ